MKHKYQLQLTKLSLPKSEITRGTMVLQFAFHIILIILWPMCPRQLASATVLDPAMAKPGCDSRCGSVEIPYPFGIKDPKCYAESWFEIGCRNTSQGDQTPYLKSINLEVTSIYLEYGKVGIMNPIYRKNCNNSKDARQVIDLRGSPFVYSQEDNNFVGVGCNNFALLQSNGSEVGGCVSICDGGEININRNKMDGGCRGGYCCETSLPENLSEYNATLEDITNSGANDECSYAVIVGQGLINMSNNHVFVYDSGKGKISPLENLSTVPAVLEWENLNETLDPKAKCDYNTNPMPSQNRHSDRRCQCAEPYYGNPYFLGGCKKIGDITTTTVALWPTVLFSLGFVILILGLWRLYKVLRKRRIKKRKEKFFKQNGGLLLQQKLSSGVVDVDKAKHFSLKDLAKATDHFNTNRVLGKGGQGTVYKGMLVDGKIVAVKKSKMQGMVEEFINEVVILSQINHRNVVKLLGCCLETEVPLLVYEFIPNGTLFEYLHEQNEELPMTWDMRLRIATEVAEALFYLHSAASQPIYHRDIKSTNILLDGKYRAKVADFGTSRMISIEDTHLTTIVQGTFGYLDPEYFHTSQFTEKSDVYSFGVVLVELLTGLKPISSTRPDEAKSLASYFIISIEENLLLDIIDERVLTEGEKEHIIAVANLAKRCLDLNGKNRPTMKEVTIELEGVWRLEKKSSPQQQHEENELVGIENYQPWAGSTSNTTGPTLDSRPPSSEVVPILISNTW